MVVARALAHADEGAVVLAATLAHAEDGDDKLLLGVARVCLCTPVGNSPWVKGAARRLEPLETRLPWPGYHGSFIIQCCSHGGSYD